MDGFELLKQYQAIRKPKKQLWEESLNAGLQGVAGIGGALIDRSKQAQSKQEQLEQMRQVLEVEKDTLIDKKDQLIQRQMQGDLGERESVIIDTQLGDIDRRLMGIQQDQARAGEDFRFRTAGKALPTIGKFEATDPSARLADIQRKEDQEAEAAKPSRGSTATITEYEFLQGLRNNQGEDAVKEFLSLKRAGKTVDLGYGYGIIGPSGNVDSVIEKGQEAETKVVGGKVVTQKAAKAGEVPEVVTSDAPKTEEEKAQEKANYDAVVSDMRQMADDLEDAFNVMRSRNVGGMGTGFQQQFTESDENYVRSLIQSVVGKLTLKNITDLKKQGGTLGAISGSELEILKATEGELFPENAPPRLVMRNLSRFYNAIAKGGYGEGNYAPIDSEQFRPPETLQKKAQEPQSYEIGERVNLPGGRVGIFRGINPDTGKAKIEVLE